MPASRSWCRRTKDDIGRVSTVIGVPVVEIVLLVCISGDIESPVVFNLESPEEWIVWH
jgi:hypothetical protein